MNTIQIQLNERKLADLTELLDEGLDAVSYKLRKEEADHYTQEDRDEITRLCGEGVSEIRQAIENRSYLWTESQGRIELDIPASIVEQVAQSGDNLPAVEDALNGHPYIVAQLGRYDSKVLEDSIDEIGLEQPAHEMNIRTMHQYLLWMACWDIFDEQNQED